MSRSWSCQCNLGKMKNAPPVIGRANNTDGASRWYKKGKLFINYGFFNFEFTDLKNLSDMKQNHIHKKSYWQ